MKPHVHPSRRLATAQLTRLFPRLLTFLAALLTGWLAGLSLPAHAGIDGASVVTTLVQRGDRALDTYQPAQPLPTAQEFSALYFDVFEGSGMELDLGLKSPGLKNDIEIRFGAVNGRAIRGVPAEELAQSWHALRDKLNEAGTLYGETESAGFLPTLAKSTLILLREGLEAMLIVGALAAYLRRAGAADRTWVLYAGVGVAIPLSLLTGWALTGILQAAGASRPVIEGWTLLTAAGVLIYVGFWLFSRREAQRWQAWIAGQVDSALSRGSLIALGAAACLAVYREGAETVLFYHALAAGSPGQANALAGGIALAGLLLLGAFLLINRLALRLPFRPFFTTTAALVYGLGVVFLGQGIIELQAAGTLPATPLDTAPQIAWLGIGPTVQGLTSQAALLLLPPALWTLRLRTTPLPSRP